MGHVDESRNLNNRVIWKSPSTAGVESERERAAKQIERDERRELLSDGANPSSRELIRPQAKQERHRGGDEILSKKSEVAKSFYGLEISEQIREEE